MLNLETKLAHPKKDPVVEVAEKVKNTENQNTYELPFRSYVFKCDQCELKYKKKLSKAYGHQELKKYLKSKNTCNSKVNFLKHMNKEHQ